MIHSDAEAGIVDGAGRYKVDRYPDIGMDNDSTDLILTLYCEQEITEYAARELLDDKTVDCYNERMKEARRLSGPHRTTSDGMDEWPDDVPMPYGHLPEEDYWVEDSVAAEDV